MKKDIAVSLDDFCDDYKNNAMNYLWWLKSKYPTFCVTLFTIPNRISGSALWLMRQNSSWMQFAVHGWNHDLEEVMAWDIDECNGVLDACEAMGVFKKGFKAPNWAISETMMDVLARRGYWLASKETMNFPGLKEFPLSHPWCMHGHTWDLNNPDPSFNNGIRQWIEEKGLPFDENTNFHMIDHVMNPKNNPVSHG